MRSEVKELSSAAMAAGAARSLFFVEYGMGHKTHLRFLEEHLDRDPRFDATLIRLYWMDDLAEWLGRFHLLPFRNAGLDFWTWWIFQFKRQQVRYLLRRYDPDNLDLVYIHTQTAATSVLDLPKHVPTVVSIDLTWKLAFQESRYHVSPLLKPTLELGAAHLRAERPGHLLLRLGGVIGDRRLRHPRLEGQGGAQRGDAAAAADGAAPRQWALAERTWWGKWSRERSVP